MSRILLVAPLPFCISGHRYGLSASVSRIAYRPSAVPSIFGFKVCSADLISPMDLDSAVNEPDQVLKWLPPRVLRISDAPFIRVRLTHVDGAFQLYGHLYSSRYELREMRAHFRDRYEKNFHPEDIKEEWKVGEACVAKLLDNNTWWRAQIIELNEWDSEVAIIFVDLGTVRVAKMNEIRIARAFGDKV